MSSFAVILAAAGKAAALKTKLQEAVRALGGPRRLVALG